MRRSLKAKVELAFTDYLKRRAQLAGGAIAGLHFYPEPETEDGKPPKKKLPCLVAFVDEAEQIVDDGPYQADLFLYLMTQADDESADIHDERLWWVQNELKDSGAVKAALNYVGDPDNRAVKEFFLYGYHEARVKDDRAGRHFGEHLFYRVACADRDFLPS
jgi:hypothetical protein